MGTRCTISIHYGKTKLNLYRHWDGYVSETGYELSQLLLGHKTVLSFIKGVINQKRAPYHMDIDRNQYELLDCDVSKVGDAEFRYFFKSKEAEAGLDFSVEVLKRTSFENDTWQTIFKDKGKKDHVAKNYMHFCRQEWEKQHEAMIKSYQKMEVA